MKHYVTKEISQRKTHIPIGFASRDGFGAFGFGAGPRGFVAGAFTGVVVMSTLAFTFSFAIFVRGDFVARAAVVEV